MRPIPNRNQNNSQSTHPPSNSAVRKYDTISIILTILAIGLGILVAAIAVVIALTIQNDTQGRSLNIDDMTAEELFEKQRSDARRDIELVH